MSVGRPLEFDPDIALEAAMQLFWNKGYESSSLQELLNSMRISKSSFYMAFKSKHALFERCIKHYRQSLTDSIQAQLEESVSVKIFISNMIHSIADEIEGPNACRGCLLMNTASEFAQKDARISKLITHSIDKLTDIFEMEIKQAQRSGEIASNKDAHYLATYLVCSISGLKNMVKAGADKKTVKNVADIILTVLEYFFA